MLDHGPVMPMGKINSRRWLSWCLESCAQAGGKAPVDVASLLLWNLTPQMLQELRQDPAPAELDPDTSRLGQRDQTRRAGSQSVTRFLCAENDLGESIHKP